MFTEVNRSEQDGRVALGTVAERSDGEILVVVRVHSCEMRATTRELLSEPFAVRKLIDTTVLRKVEGL